MSNPHRGIVDVRVGDKIYSLHFSINAMVALEDAFSQPIINIAKMIGSGENFRIKTLRTLFWCGLKDYHEAITEVDAGRIMDDIGIPQSMELVAKAFAQAFPSSQVSGPLDNQELGQSHGKAH